MHIYIMHIYIYIYIYIYAFMQKYENIAWYILSACDD